MCSFSAFAEGDSENAKPTYSTPEEFLDIFVSEDENFSDGGLIYVNNNKTAVELHEDSSIIATIIIYGFENVYNIGSSGVKLNLGDYSYMESPDGYYSGMYGFLSAENENGMISREESIKIVYFANDIITDYQRKNLDLFEACKLYDFDVAPYVYTTLTPGDADCDGLISADDASMVLSAYSMQSTGEKLILNSTIFDYNNNGLVDADDASEILSKYTELSTT